MKDFISRLIATIATCIQQIQTAVNPYLTRMYRPFGFNKIPVQSLDAITKALTIIAISTTSITFIGITLTLLAYHIEKKKSERAQQEAHFQEVKKERDELYARFKTACADLTNRLNAVAYDPEHPFYLVIEPLV